MQYEKVSLDYWLEHNYFWLKLSTLWMQSLLAKIEYSLNITTRLK